MSRIRTLALSLQQCLPEETDLDAVVRFLLREPLEDAAELVRALRRRPRCAALEDVSPGLADALEEVGREGRAEREADACRARGWTVVDCLDPAYPACLLDLPGPPVALTLRGHGPWPPPMGVTVVGARRSTALGRSFAHSLGEAVGRRGGAVTSGLALGIDQASLQGGLGGRAPVYAVLACGVDRIYPRGAERLALRIEESGRILSEAPLGTPPHRWLFPRRNRILAALTPATLVVEADLRSGSLITARIAAELGREVWAVPGSLDRDVSRGANRLLRDGAHPLIGLEDLDFILRGLPSATEGTTEGATDGADGADAAEQRLLDLLALPRSLSALAEHCGLSISSLEVLLTEWETQQRVELLAGGLYRRRGTSTGLGAPPP